MSAPLVAGVACARPGCGHGEDLHDGICFGTACECVRFVGSADVLPVPVGPVDGRDFYRPGHTYSYPVYADGYDWKFRVDAVVSHPEDGERTALGWRFWKGQWEPIAYGEDDWDVHSHDPAGSFVVEPTEDGPTEEPALAIADVAAWLRKKAREYPTAPERQESPAEAIARLAEKVARGAIRPKADGITRQIAPTQTLREDSHDGPLHHDYRVSRDLPETGGIRDV